jgi:hypothetical protein
MTRLAIATLLFAADAPAEREDGRTPRTELRPISPDRPDVTESPYTVDAGRFQLEASVLEYAAGAEAFSFLPFNFKFGVTPRVDLQLLVEPLVVGDDAEFGDVSLRAKLNVWGNDGGDTAFAVMPFVTLPTSEGSRRAEGGLILPFAIAMDAWSFGTMAEFDVAEDAGGGGAHFEALFTVSASRPIEGDLSGFVELAFGWSDDRGAGTSVSLNAGLVYALRENLLVDCGVYIGLDGDVDDLVLVLGITRRF